MTGYNEKRERRIGEYDHRHDTTGSFLPAVSAPVIDGAEPIDDATGLRISVSLTEPWRYPLDDPRYTPHPNSIAARTGN